MLGNSFKTTAHPRITASLDGEECRRSRHFGYLILTISHGYKRSQQDLLTCLEHTNDKHLLCQETVLKNYLILLTLNGFYRYGLLAVSFFDKN